MTRKKKGKEKVGSSSSGPPGLPFSKKGKDKEGSSSSGPPDVPGGETDERKNKRCVSVFVLGHVAAGKSMALRKINELENDRVKLEKATQHFDKVTMDESAQGRLMEHAMDNFEDELEGEAVAIRKIRYETTASIFHFFEAPSDYHYVSNMMSEAMRANLAVLFLSESNGEEDDIDDSEKVVQLEGCIHLILTLKFNKVLIVVNKIDNPNEMQESYNETVNCLTSLFVEVGTDIKFIPLSLKNGFNFQTTMGESCTWWDGPCFIQALDEFEVQPARTIEALTQEGKKSSDEPTIKETILDLVITDLTIDIMPTGKLWYKRALALSRLKKIAAAFEAARKAGEICYFKNPDKTFNLASFLTAGHYYRTRNDFDKAIEWFNKVKDFYNVKSYNAEVLQLVGSCLIQAWSEKHDGESRTKILTKPKGESSVVPEIGDVRVEKDDNEVDKN